MERTDVFCERLPVTHLFTYEIFHDGIAVAGGIAERPARDRSDVLFELADEAGFDGPMA